MTRQRQRSEPTAKSRQRVERLARARMLFTHPTTPGILLIVCTALALAAANSGFSEQYLAIFSAPLTIGYGAYALSKPLALWINDGLMAIFFFAIGLEIKRELLVGHLSSIKRSALPILAALGGMVVPAAIYAAMNSNGPGAHGWAIPMATDIAFAVGVLLLLGARVPYALKVFLLALAIVDDLGAVLVIAIFYTDTIALGPLFIALAAWAVAIGLNNLRVRAPGWYALLGIVVWLGMLKSGVHATIAGVLMGFAIPVRRVYDGPRWLALMQNTLDRYRGVLDVHIPGSHEEIGARQQIVHEIEKATERAQSPLIRLEHGLAPWVSFLIMPVFAFTNAGVIISGDSIGAALANSVTWGVFLGLFLGKQVGVFLFSWLAVRFGLADKPEGTTWTQFYGVSILAGIGFTMSLFITELSFKDHEEFTAMAKLAILAASAMAAVMGYAWLRVAIRNVKRAAAA